MPGPVFNLEMGHMGWENGMGKWEMGHMGWENGMGKWDGKMGNGSYVPRGILIWVISKMVWNKI